MTFLELGIPPLLAQALAARGLGVPLPVQEQAAPVLLGGKSAMVVSRTGSGKTLAYLLPILTRINPSVPNVQAVILAPTHELAMQIFRVASELIREAGLEIRVQSLIGGAASARQVEGLKKKPHIVVGSAGRLVHLMDLGKLKLRNASWLVFDEADRLLIEEGLEHIRRITGEVGADARFVFVSATEGPATTRVAKSLAPDLEVVRVQEERISPAIRHFYLLCEERDKTEWLRKAVRGLSPERTLVFVHRGASAERLAERLDYHQLAVADLHGARDKFARQAALDAFRRGQAKVLIASDIAARGLDIMGVELVVNLDVPSQSRDYLHRAGRTGRAGAPGAVLSLMTMAESRLARRYAEELGIVMEPVQLVRGTLVPADEKDVQNMRPLSRPTGLQKRRAGFGSRQNAPTAGTEGSAEKRTGSRPGSERPRDTGGAAPHSGTDRKKGPVSKGHGAGKGKTASRPAGNSGAIKGNPRGTAKEKK